MRTIRISEEVWAAMAQIGKFGETPDDVLRKVLNIKSKKEEKMAQRLTQKRPSYATMKMSAYIARNELHVEFANGVSNSWPLPDRNDKTVIRKVRDASAIFAEQNGASLGQINAVKKTLTDSGYHLIK